MYGVNDQQLAAICRGMRHDEYMGCRAEGMSFADADSACAVIGIATVTKTERPKNGRPLIWTAIKRCEKDFYSRAFPYIPGEGQAGAGMRKTERGFEPDFQDGHWVIEQPIEEREMPTGASIDWLRNKEHIEADKVVYVEAEEPEEEEEQGEPAESEGPEWLPMQTDLRAALEETEVLTLSEVIISVAVLPLYEGEASVFEIASEWPEFKSNNIKAALTMPLKQATALRLFDWLCEEPEDLDSAV